MKTFSQPKLQLQILSLYPTFEEWKLEEKIFCEWRKFQSLYPTFEEWFDAWLMANSAGEKWRVRSD